MLNKIIISALLLMCVSLHAQVLPVEADEKVKIAKVEFGSGSIYDFEDVDHSGFYAAIKLMESLKYGEASRSFYEYYEKYPDVDQNSSKALFYAGECAYRNNEFSRAKRIFIELVDKEFKNENANHYLPQQKPSHVVKNEACTYLAKLFIADKDFTTALKYIELHQKIYTKQSFCGNCSAYDEFNSELLYADCMIGLGRKEEASQLLLQYLFNPIGFTDFSAAADRMVPLLQEKYDRDYLRNELAKAIENVVLDKIYFKLKYLEVEYKLMLNWKKNKHSFNDHQTGKISDQEFINIFKESFKENHTYKLIMQD